MTYFCKGVVIVRKNLWILSVNSITHALVDAACAALVIGIAELETAHIDAFSVVLLYNLLAFAAQPLFGLVTDKYFNAAKVAALGCVMTAGGLLLFSAPFLAVMTVGIGNALFHVGGGIISLRIQPGRAWAPGVFVAPGDIGLVIGTLLGKYGYEKWAFVIPLLLTAVIISAAGVPKRNVTFEAVIEKGNGYFRIIGIIVALIMITVFIRSFTGMAISFTWKKDFDLLLMIAASVSMGKAIGGFLADKYGWLKVPVIGLVLSIPLLTVGFTWPIAGLLGLLLFNFTMPVTLTVLANIFPKYEGFAFGLTVIALSLGTIPVFAGIRLNQEIGVVIVLLVSTMTLFGGLYAYQNLWVKKEWRAY